VTLAEMCIAGGVGIEGRPGLTHDLPEAAWLFSESANRVVCGIDPANVETVEQLANDAQVPFRRLGIARGQRLSLPSVISVPLASIDDVWSNSIERTMKSVSAQQA
jgi:phosphoribosylformylglycinamidine (FGAM) synthase-like enzyme